MERHQGDLNDVSPKPSLRYLGSDGQLADGIYNPTKILGFLSPANAKFSTLSGTVSAPINSIQYEPDSDTVYLSEEGTNILSLSSLDDSSLSNHLTISTGKIKDMIIYEMNAQKSLLYAIDSEDTETGSYVGFSSLVPGEGILAFEAEVFSVDNTFSGSIAPVASESTASQIGRRLGLVINSGDLSSLTFKEAFLSLSRTGSTSGVTFRLTIEPVNNGAPELNPRGTWSTSTSYAKDDYVLQSGNRFQCFVAHTSSGTNQPEVGASWQDFWNYASQPTGATVASATFSFDDVPALASADDATEENLVRVEFSSPVVLEENRRYWFIIEEVGSNMAGSDRLFWLRSNNANGTYFFKSGASYAGISRVFYETADYWRDVNEDGDELTSDHDNFNIKLISTADEDWSSTVAEGKFIEETGKDMFFYLADNALAYWVVGNKVNVIDGGGTGGFFGRVNRNVLTFPSYIKLVDITETRSRMYFGVQTSDTENGNRRYSANRIGVYVWDRRSQVLGSSDYYPCPGAREFKSLFTGHDGNVYAITVGNSGFSEIRAISGNQFAVIQTFEADGYPKARSGVGIKGSMTTWLGKNGIFYEYGPTSPGQRDALHKTGDMSGEAGSGLEPGPIFIGHEEASGPRMGVLFGWKDATNNRVQLWYPNGEGTIDSVEQTANVGNVYTGVRLLPGLSTVSFIHLFGKPTVTDSTDDIATVKIYFNMSTTPWATKIIRKRDMNKGYYEIPVNKPNVNSVQIKFEWATDEIIGDDTFCPFYALLDYEPTATAGINKN